jgi:acyl-coenzyme A thioesterase PaaI-like protein
MPSSLVATYDRLRGFPGGSRLFDASLALVAPFNLWVAPRVRELAAGRAVLEMADRPWRRNHLRSLHAMALSTLAEITANVAVIASLPPGVDMIPTRFSIMFLAKARGRITAHCQVDLEAIAASPVEIDVKTELRDGDGRVVGKTVQTCRLRWNKARA